MKKHYWVLISLVVIPLIFWVLTSTAVLAVSGVDNFQAYQEVLQAIAQTTIGAIGEGWTGTANALDKGLGQMIKAFEKVIVP